MPKPDKVVDELMGYWYHALRTTHGLRLESPDRQFLINSLYTARQASMDDDLDALAIVKSSTDDRVIWIVFKDDATDSGRTPGEDLG
jgi:hypothetical protein